MLERWKFGDSALRGDKRRNHSRMSSRFRIECGIKGPLNASGYIKGQRVFTRKRPYFVCIKCGTLNETERPFREFCREICESCFWEGTEHKSSKDQLEEAWSVARSVDEKRKYHL